MSVENNSLRSIDGLNTISCDTINVVESIEIDGDNGTNNQILRSNGTKTLWSDLYDLLAQLSVSAPLSFATGSFYNGSVARAITIADGAIGNVKLEHSTISGKALGTNLETLNFDAPLSNLDYNGGTARTITIADGDIGNAKLTNSTISGISLGSNLNVLNFNTSSGLIGLDDSGSTVTDYNGNAPVFLGVELKGSGGISKDADGLSLTNNSISGIVLGGNLTSLLVDTPLSYVSGSTYNGATERSLQISNIANNKLANSTISGVSLGSNLNNLGLYFGLSFLSGNANYNGSASETIQLDFKSGGNINADANGLFISNQTATLGVTSLTLGATTADLNMSDDSGVKGSITNANLLGGSNLLTNERLAYYDTGTGSARWIYIMNAGDWRPNDDQSYFNIAIEDDHTTSKVVGRGRTHSTSLEAMGVFTIPQGWTPTGIFVDVRDSSGNNEPEQLDVYKVKQFGGSNGTLTDLVGFTTTGTERTFTSSYGVADPTTALLVEVHLNGTADYIGGGYIVLTPPS